MKTLLGALIVLCATLCTPGFAAPAQQDSKVLVPPLISMATSKSSQPTISSITSQSGNQPMDIRLPTRAGKVSKIVTTNLVAKGPSWIAEGDSYYSLCVPNPSMVACRRSWRPAS